MFISMCTVAASPTLSLPPESKIFLLGSSLKLSKCTYCISRWHMSTIRAAAVTDDPDWVIAGLSTIWQNPELRSDNLQPDPRRWGMTMLWLSHIRLSLQEMCFLCPSSGEKVSSSQAIWGVPKVECSLLLKSRNVFTRNFTEAV